MKFTTRMLLAATVAVTPLAAASAATIVQTINFAGPTDLNDATGINTYNGQSFFAFFDSSLGTLSGVTIGSTYAYSTDVSITGSADAIGTISTESGSQFNSSDATMDTLFNKYLNNLTTGGRNPAPVVVNLSGKTLSPVAFDEKTAAQSFSLANGPFSASYSASDGFAPYAVDAGDVASFAAVGGGSFNALLQTLTGTILSTSTGNATASQTSNATGSVTITYDYAPAASAVPEPATWGMMVIGFGAMGLSMRRRQQKVGVRFN